MCVLCVCVCVRACVRAFVCVCVCERERGREGANCAMYNSNTILMSHRNQRKCTPQTGLAYILTQNDNLEKLKGHVAQT